MERFVPFFIRTGQDGKGVYVGNMIVAVLNSAVFGMILFGGTTGVALALKLFT